MTCGMLVISSNGSERLRENIFWLNLLGLVIIYLLSLSLSRLSLSPPPPPPPPPCLHLFFRLSLCSSPSLPRSLCPFAALVCRTLSIPFLYRPPPPPHTHTHTPLPYCPFYFLHLSLYYVFVCSPPSLSVCFSISALSVCLSVCLSINFRSLSSAWFLRVAE